MHIEQAGCLGQRSNALWKRKEQERDKGESRGANSLWNSTQCSRSACRKADSVSMTISTPSVAHANTKNAAGQAAQTWSSTEHIAEEAAKRTKQRVLQEQHFQQNSLSIWAQVQHMCSQTKDVRYTSPSNRDHHQTCTFPPSRGARLKDIACQQKCNLPTKMHR